jgi:hypothetical protein
LTLGIGAARIGGMRSPLLRPALVASALAAGVLLAPAALGLEGGDGPTWVPDLRKALEKARERGNPVLVWCNTDGEAQNQTDQTVMKNPEVLKAMKGYLVVYGNNTDHHGSQDGTIDGKPAKVCKLAPGITCADHKRIIDQVYTTYSEFCVDKQSNLKMPVHFVVGADAKVVLQINAGTLASGFDAVAPGAMTKGLKDGMAKVGGPGLTDEQFEGLRKAIASARSSVDQKRMSEAAKALAPFSAIRKKISILDEAREVLKSVDREAAPKLAEGKARLAAEPIAAVALLEQVATDYPGTDSAVAARKIVDEFRESPAGKKAVKDVARDAEGRAELDKAWAMAESGKDDAAALRLLDGIAKKYAGLPSGEDAKTKAAAIRADSPRMAAIEKVAAERAATGALTAAKGLIDAGKKDEARKALQEIVTKHAGTAAAGEATKLLEGLR